VAPADLSSSADRSFTTTPDGESLVRGVRRLMRRVKGWGEVSPESLRNRACRTGSGPINKNLKGAE
jgi:hypothetical protein